MFANLYPKRKTAVNLGLFSDLIYLKLTLDIANIYNRLDRACCMITCVVYSQEAKSVKK